MKKFRSNAFSTFFCATVLSFATAAGCSEFDEDVPAGFDSTRCPLKWDASQTHIISRNVGQTLPGNSLDDDIALDDIASNNPIVDDSASNGLTPFGENMENENNAPNLEHLHQIITAHPWTGSGDYDGVTLTITTDGKYAFTRKEQRKDKVCSCTFDSGTYILETDETLKPIIHFFHNDDDTGWLSYFTIIENELRILEATDFSPYMSFFATE